MINKVFIQEKILDIIQVKPGISAPMIAEAMDMSRVTAFRYLRALIQLNKIRTQGNGRATRYFPHELLYIGNNLMNISGKGFDSNQIFFLKEDILFHLREEYDEVETQENLDATFEKYCMYIAPDDTIITGFDAFLAWCTDPKHNFSDRIVSKATEYLEIISSIEMRRKKNGFLDGTESARTNLNGLTEISFNVLYFLMPSVLENGFGRTRTAIELYYGKLNNKYLLQSAIEKSIDTIRDYIKKQEVDGYILTPPTNNRTVQFRDVIDNMLDLKIPRLPVEKVPPLGKVLQPQKDIKDRVQRVNNAFLSLDVPIPKELSTYLHILIIDDSFTTGATPNAIALKLRKGGYEGKITIITICGSFNYNLAITEDEV